MNSELLGAIARGYCHPNNSSKVLDPDLCNAIAEEVQKLLNSESKELKKTIASLRYELDPSICDSIESAASKFYNLFEQENYLGK